MEDTMPVHLSQAVAYDINASEGNRRTLRLVVHSHNTEALFYTEMNQQDAQILVTSLD
jgi:hypothetical protein